MSERPEGTRTVERATEGNQNREREAVEASTKVDDSLIQRLEKLGEFELARFVRERAAGQ